MARGVTWFAISLAVRTLERTKAWSSSSASMRPCATRLATATSTRTSCASFFRSSPANATARLCSSCSNSCATPHGFWRILRASVRLGAAARLEGIREYETRAASDIFASIRRMATGRSVHAATHGRTPLFNMELQRRQLPASGEIVNYVGAAAAYAQFLRSSTVAQRQREKAL